jgi:hypothetical protein
MSGKQKRSYALSKENRKGKFYERYEEIPVHFLISQGLSGWFSGAITIGKGSQKIRKKFILAKGGLQNTDTGTSMMGFNQPIK